MATNTILCQGDSTTLFANGAFNYNWFYLQGSTLVPISSSSNSISVVPPTIGINTYVVTGSGPCSSSTSDTKTITITVTPKTTLLVTPLQDVTKCMNKSFIVTTNVGSTIPINPGTPYTYSWTTLPSNTPAPGATNSPSYTVTSNTTSTFVITVSGVCAYSASDTIVVSNFVDDLGITINDSSSTCAGIPFVLNASASGGHPAYNYQWTMVPNTNVISNTSVLNYISPDTEGNYTFAVLVGDSCGYTHTTYQVINVLPPCSVVIPNIITPNGDGANDFFKIKNIEHHPNINVTIFDRWGNKVYENPNYNNEWNGSGVADGTFFYVVDVPDDKKYSGFITVFKGK
jgi:gliding motility-associated-like protein